MTLRQMWASLVALPFLFSGSSLFSQTPRARLTSAIDNSSRTTLSTLHPAYAQTAAAPGKDLGALAPGYPLHGITLVFNRSAAQQADLDTLLAAQQNTKSPLYHKWLTPDQFAARFGMAPADMSKTEDWLRSEGFTIGSVARGYDRISFDGTAAQVSTAFGLQLHNYATATGTHFAPTGDLTLPSSLAPLVTGVLRLSSFHAHRQSRLLPVKPAYTSAQTGDHFLTPLDVATMYDMNSTYKAGYNGAGQAIAVIGQSYITTSAISAFQTGAGLTANLPTMVLVPDSGVNGIDAISDGDEGESQLDVEYASGMAPGASIYFVYTGDDSNSGVFDSLSYAIEEDIAPIISGSYGTCETEVSSLGTSAASYADAFTAEVQQANAQGQTVLFAAGDAGSTACYGDTDFGTAQQEALAVGFPASVPEVTALGGTEMPAGTFSSTNTQYWQSASGTDTISSLLSYVPETTWNEDASYPLASGGGGASVLYTRPSWQTSLSGIPAGTTRLVPDISLQASIVSPGYIYCTSDAADLAGSGVTASCTSGLRSSSGTYLLAGGTSFSTPIFAGMLAVLNQVTHASGQGNVNPTLYSLASNATTYASVFHDITSGTNACTAGSTYCSTAGAASYAAATGYDEATGLGSIDFAKLVAAWPTSTAASLTATTTVITSATSSPAAGAADLLTVTVAPQGTATATPTGTLQLVVNGTAVTPTLALANGVATYTFTAPATTGSYVVTATYSGDTTFAASTGSTVLNVGSATATGSFTLSASNLTVVANSTASSTFTITPASGYTGTVAVALSYPSSAPTLCYNLTNNFSNGSNVPMINNGLAIPVTLTIGEGTVCTSSSSANMVQGGNRNGVRNALLGKRPGHSGHWPEGIAFAGLFCVGLGFRRSRRLPALLSYALLAVVGLGLSGCGGSNVGGTTTTSTPAQPTTVTITLTGADTVNTSITNSTSFTLTIQ